MSEWIAYETTAEDVADIAASFSRPAFGSKNWGRHERWRRVLAGMSLCGLVFCLIKLYVHRVTDLDLPPWEDGLAFLAAGGFVGWRLRPKPFTVAENDPRLGRRDFYWWDGGFEITGDDFRVGWHWPAVTDIRDVAGHLVFTVRTGDLYAVPLRALDPPDEEARSPKIRAAWEAGRGM